jgi:hypothetical protein
MEGKSHSIPGMICAQAKNMTRSGHVEPPRLAISAIFSFIQPLIELQ